MKTSSQKAVRRRQGFTLIELMISMAVLMVVLGVAFRYISVATQRSQAEQTKIDLSQEAREFVDEFERDLHQVGYPGCRMFAGAYGGLACNTYPGTAYSLSTVASGLIYVSNYEVAFEGDVDGDGVVDSVWYRVYDSDNNFPPTGTCPCTIRRAQNPKTATAPLSQVPTNWSQELQNLVNSGTTPTDGSVYGNGLPIAGTTMWGTSNTALYAAMTTFKDYPVFTAFDQNGNSVALLKDISVDGPSQMARIKSIRLTVNILANANNGYDLKTHLRPVMTLVGDGRIANCPVAPLYPCN
jgi:prepilin-type N-terminal cleavage/methylation domain-containing protein